MIETRFPFIGFKVNEFWHKKEGRFYVYLRPPQGKAKCMSKARYMFSIHLGRILNKNETVDHINDDKTDDRIENFQLLTKGDNNRKYTKTIPQINVKLKCPWCNTIFDRERRNTHLVKRKFKCTCCSRHCSGKIGAYIQINGITDWYNKQITENVIEIYTCQR